MKKVFKLGEESSIFPKDKNIKIKYQNVLEHDQEIQKNNTFCRPADGTRR